MATEAIVAPLYAPIGDRFGRRPVVLVLIAFWGLFAMGFGLSGSVIIAVLMRGCRKCFNRVLYHGLIISGATGWSRGIDQNDGRGNVRQDESGPRWVAALNTGS